MIIGRMEAVGKPFTVFQFAHSWLTCSLFFPAFIDFSCGCCLPFRGLSGLQAIVDYVRARVLILQHTRVLHVSEERIIQNFVDLLKASSIFPFQKEPSLSSTKVSSRSLSSMFLNFSVFSVKCFSASTPVANSPPQ
jgi:hypothetical protein